MWISRDPMSTQHFPFIPIVLGHLLLQQRVPHVFDHYTDGAFVTLDIYNQSTACGLLLHIQNVLFLSTRMRIIPPDNHRNHRAIQWGEWGSRRTTLNLSAQDRILLCPEWWTEVGIYWRGKWNELTWNEGKLSSTTEKEPPGKIRAC